MQSQEWCRRLLQVTPSLGSQFTKSWSVLLLLILCRLGHSSSCIPLLCYLVTCKAIEGFWWTLQDIQKLDSVWKIPQGTSRVWHTLCQGVLQFITVTSLVQWSPLVQKNQFSTSPSQHVCGHAPLSFGYLENRSWTLGYGNAYKMSVKYKRDERRNVTKMKLESSLSFPLLLPLPPSSTRLAVHFWGFSAHQEFRISVTVDCIHLPD